MAGRAIDVVASASARMSRAVSGVPAARRKPVGRRAAIIAPAFSRSVV
jgi:hypothetical protein